MNIKRWIIGMLGGITSEHQEKVRESYEAWAVKYLTGKNGDTTPNCSFYLPIYGDNITIIRSGVTINGGSVKGLKVAPWCKNVVVSGVVFLEDSE
jgi:hypothetical protein